MDKLLLGLALIFILTYLWYVSLVKKHNTALEALSGIDQQLAKRADLVPNILKNTQGFMDHEKSLLAEIHALRTQLTRQYNKADPNAVKDHITQAEQLSDKMGALMQSVENYPELKSDNSMLDAMQSYSEGEAYISAARRFYNSAVSELNTAVEIFPGSIIATIAKIKVMPFYGISGTTQAPIDAAD